VKAERILIALLFVVTISQAVMLVWYQNRPNVWQQRYNTVVQLDTCWINHATKLSLIGEGFIRGRMLHTDFRAMWDQEMVRFKEKCAEQPA
jgi:hypothetical protein